MNVQISFKTAILAVILLLAGCRSSIPIAVNAAEIPDKVQKPIAELYIKETISPEEVLITENVAAGAEMDGFSLEELKIEKRSLICLGKLYSGDSELQGEDKEGDTEDLHLEEEPAAENKTYYGSCTITHYCNCSACCKQWAGGATASGVMPQAGVTVASGDLPFGTQIEINGERYIVQDRGVIGMRIDIYCASHDEAVRRGMYTADVYVIR